jgi:putative transposase
MVEAPGHYRWSSYRHHAEGICDTLLSSHEQYFQLGHTPEERQLAYRGFFVNELDKDALSEIRGSVNRGWPLGSEKFKDEIEGALLRAVRPPKRGRPARVLSRPPGHQRELPE